jgi:ribosomal protein L35AE/L33A
MTLDEADQHIGDAVTWTNADGTAVVGHISGTDGNFVLVVLASGETATVHAIGLELTP